MWNYETIVSVLYGLYYMYVCSDGSLGRDS